MNLNEINEKIFREDKMMVAVEAEVTEDYVNKILAGERNADTPKAQFIVKKLAKLARLNDKVKKQKEKVLSTNTILLNLRTNFSKKSA